MSVKEVQHKQCRRVNDVCGEDNGDSLCSTDDWEQGQFDDADGLIPGNKEVCGDFQTWANKVHYFLH